MFVHQRDDISGFHEGARCLPTAASLSAGALQQTTTQQSSTAWGRAARTRKPVLPRQQSDEDALAEAHVATLRPQLPPRRRRGPLLATMASKLARAGKS